MKVSDFYDFLDKWAPFRTMLPYDNAGLLVGSPDCEVSGVMLCLDITSDVINGAREQGCDLIISHHPVIFDPLKALPCAAPAYMLAHEGMSAICAHTNLDAASGGVNDMLAKALGLSDVTPLAHPETPNLPPLARMGSLPKEMSVSGLAKYAGEKLGCSGVRFTGNDEKITRVALCGGGGMGFCEVAAASGAQALITGECKYSDALAAKIPVIDCGHFCTENVIVNELKSRLCEAFPNMKIVAATQGDIFNYITR